MTLISLANVTVCYGGNAVLDAVSLTLDPAEIVTIVGPNGSGKSTLLRTIVGAVIPASGQVTRRKDLRIGYVPQTLTIDSTLPMTVRRVLDLPRKVSEAQAREAMAWAGIKGLGHRQISSLSGGQFQRTLLARALLSRPEVLILDEATQGLDQPGCAAFYQRIAQLRTEFRCAVLMVSHQLHVVMAASDRVICLNGHVCCQGAPGQVASAPEYRALFGSGTAGALAIYRHDHNHDHDPGYRIDAG
ncbi:MAG: metal ABC transporter ATP-binding protein [Rhodobacteraceae bacterium]|nr:metal ABC transporter ATP-binding protein [Paracoccaceae bacterium]